MSIILTPAGRRPWQDGRSAPGVNRSRVPMPIGIISHWNCDNGRVMSHCRFTPPSKAANFAYDAGCSTVLRRAEMPVK